MKRLFFTFLLISLTVNNVSAQGTISAERLEKYYKLLFDFKKELLEEPDFYGYKEVVSREISKLEKTVVPQKLIRSITDSLTHTADLSFYENTSHKKKLGLKAEIPETMDTYDLDLSSEESKLKIFDIELLHSNIYGKNNRKIEISNSSGYFSSNRSKHIIVNGNAYTYKYQRINKEYRVSDTLKLNEPMAGNATYRLKFISGIVSKELTKQNMRDTFFIRDQKYRIVDILYNKVIYEIIDSPKDVFEDNDYIRIVNHSKDGAMTYTSYEPSELDSLRQTDSRYDKIYNYTYKTTFLDPEVYELYIKYKDLSFEEFKKTISPETIQKLYSRDFSKNRKMYYIIFSPAPITYFTLYKPEITEEVIEIPLRTQ